MAKVLVYGWYGRGNLGDELMAQALLSMLNPHGIDLQFVDYITGTMLIQSDGVIFGGGSMLYDKPVIDKDAFDMLQKNMRPCFYVGVGIETEVHADHRSLMQIARVVITRSPTPWPDWVPKQTYGAPDLVYALPQGDVDDDKHDVLFIPNVEVLPTWNEPHWKHVAFERFKDECAQFMDQVIDERLTKCPAFLIMCQNSSVNDAWVATEIVARMKNRSTYFDLHANQPVDSQHLTNLVSRYKVVITQRYHGIILAEMAGVPCISIDHHDKLKYAWPRRGENLPYHGLTKDGLFSACKSAMKSKCEPSRVSREVYDGLASAMSQIVTQERRSRVEESVRRDP